MLEIIPLLIPTTFRTGPAWESKISRDLGGTWAVEWAPWANNWLVKAEYLNYNFGGVWVAPFGTSDLTINEVRAGLAYKFGS